MVKLGSDCSISVLAVPQEGSSHKVVNTSTSTYEVVARRVAYNYSINLLPKNNVHVLGARLQEYKDTNRATYESSLLWYNSNGEEQTQQDQGSYTF